jgi:hypothetical protein
MASVGHDLSVDLYKAINTMDCELQAKFGRPFFDNTGRGQAPRDMIMGLPADYGWMVFKAVLLRVQVAKNPDELYHEFLLICKLGWQALIDQAVPNPTGYIMEGNTLDTPRNFDQVHNHIVQPKACSTDPAVDTNINLENACCDGKSSEADKFGIPPWRLWRQGCKKQTSEEPGLLAGVLARQNLPRLIGGNFDDSSPNYVWVPLRKFVDIHRVLHKAKESQVFRFVSWCTANSGVGDQIRHWAQVNPHQLEVHTWRSGTRYTVGVTDENDGVEKVSSSGWHLFVMGPNTDGELEEVIGRVGSLLWERDFDRGETGFKCILKNNSVVHWGMAPGHVGGDSDMRMMLGLPDMSPENTLGIQDGRALLLGAQQRAEPWPNHSRVRETVDRFSAATDCSTMRLKTMAMHDRTNDTCTAFCNVRNTDMQIPRQPPASQQQRHRPPPSSPGAIAMSPVVPASHVTLDSPDDLTPQLVSQTPIADPTAPDSLADTPIHRSGQDEENQKLSDTDLFRNVVMSPGVVAGRIGTAAGSIAEGNDIVARSGRRRIPAAVCSNSVLPELTVFSLPDGARESIGIDVPEPVTKRCKAGEAAVKPSMSLHTSSKQVQSHQQMISNEDEKQTSAVQDVFDGGGSTGGSSTGSSAAYQLETNPVMPREKKAPEVQEPPHQWNRNWDRRDERELNSRLPNGMFLSSLESTCLADAHGNGATGSPTEIISFADDDMQESTTFVPEWSLGSGSPTEIISSADEGDAEDDMQESTTFVPEWSLGSGSPTEIIRSADEGDAEDDLQESTTFVPDWSRMCSLDVEDIAVPQEPTLMWYKSPEEFGMDANFAEYLGMSERALWHVLPIVHVKFGFGEHDPKERAAYLQLVESFRHTMLVQELQESERNPFIQN